MRPRDPVLCRSRKGVPQGQRTSTVPQQFADIRFNDAQAKIAVKRPAALINDERRASLDPELFLILVVGREHGKHRTELAVGLNIRAKAVDDLVKPIRENRRESASILGVQAIGEHDP